MNDLMTRLASAASNDRGVRFVREDPEVRVTWAQVHAEAEQLAVALRTNGVRPGDHVARLGRPVPGLEMRIVDPDSGVLMGEREVGELQLRGTSLTPGYYQRPDVTADRIDNGWLRTGDLA